MSERSYLIYQVRKMAEELGRVPLQDEFCEHVGRHYIKKHFGTFNNLLRIAGLEPNKENVGRKKYE